MASKPGTSVSPAAGWRRSVPLEWLARILTLAWLTGPIFDKELRVSSRRRRNYVLRFVYVALFTCLMMLVWTESVAHSAPSVFQASRMAEAGQAILVVVVWFQFLAAQAVAAVILSTAISDEIYSRTLGTLMTTPIGSLQIVLGKLLSKLLQLLLLLAITLPMLSIVRVFGGIPWDYLACSLCVTLTTVVFVGSLSLFFSIFTRRAYAVIIATILTVSFLFALLPFISFMLLHRVISEGRLLNLFSYVNPYVVTIEAMDTLRRAGTMRLVAWPVHCIIALGASAVLLLLATVLVRRAALRQATGQTGLWSHRRIVLSPVGEESAAQPRRVVGPPIFWKERRTPLLGRRKLGMIIGLLLALGLLTLTYVMLGIERVLDDEGVQIGYVVVFFALGLLFTAVLPATCITSEKESQTWSLLLLTTVSNWEIVWGKFLGTLRRCLPAWTPLLAHVGIFTAAGIIHPVGAIQLGILVAWVTIFLSGSGLYFSTRFRHTTTAVIANISLAAGLWAIFPLLLGIALAGAGASELLGVYMDTNPMVHAVVITAATAKSGGLAAYDWIQGGIADVGEATGWILFNFVLYAAAGFVFLAVAGARLRRNPL